MHACNDDCACVSYLLASEIDSIPLLSVHPPANAPLRSPSSSVTVNNTQLRRVRPFGLQRPGHPAGAQRHVPQTHPAVPGQVSTCCGVVLWFDGVYFCVWMDGRRVCAYICVAPSWYINRPNVFCLPLPPPMTPHLMTSVRCSSLLLADTTICGQTSFPATTGMYRSRDSLFLVCLVSHDRMRHTHI